MKLIKFILLFTIPIGIQGQIVSGKQKKKQKIQTTDTTNKISLYGHMGFGSTFRVLKKSKTDFGKELGSFADESSLFVSSYQV